jgi:hypothetical protein
LKLDISSDPSSSPNTKKERSKSKPSSLNTTQAKPDDSQTEKTTQRPPADPDK